MARIERAEEEWVLFGKDSVELGRCVEVPHLVEMRSGDTESLDTEFLDEIV